MPLGRRVTLVDRGTTFVREAGDEQQPTVLLVHGWMASAGMNWAATFEPMSQHFHVLAPDLRGHGRGIRSRRRFRLEDCADDLATLIEELGCGPVVVVGYSMGGLVAQLLWRRHPDVVAGLVLCSTTRVFMPGRRERYLVGTLMNYVAGTVRASRAATRLYLPFGWSIPALRLRRRPETMRRWVAAELRRHDMRQVLEAGHATSRFDSRRWIAGVDVPTAVIVTTKDRAIPLSAQRKLAAAITDASTYEVDGDHTACSADDFQPVLVDACREIVGRAGLSEEHPPARR